ncbi:MAG: hypothetical protein M3167_01975 [Acidobacteriota bacterium]|nr:hypothetical protein [Acidobacteriota bacterium]
MRTRARRALPAILRRPGIAAIARAAAHAEAGAWIVGGAARDLLLGRADPDVDLAVSADPYALAEKLAREGFGTFVPLSDASPRVARLAGRRDIDLAAVEGAGISEDLGRRDFTVNAVAIGLGAREWTDPFGGVEDLAAGRLRAISEKNLVEDPLRVLRGARLMATHGLRPDRATTQMCARVAPLLPSAAPERIRAELEKLLAARIVRPALLWAARTGVLSPALGRVITPAAALRIASTKALDAPGLSTLPPAERLRLRLALVARALRMDPGATEAWLASRRFSRAEAREVADLLDLICRAGSASGDLEMWRWVRDAAGRASLALRLAGLLDDPGPAVRAGLARRLRVAKRPPRVTGRDIQAWLGIPPGPPIGEALASIEVEGIRGAVRSRAGARKWITERLSRPS